MNLSKQKLPKKYFKAGKECYLDPIWKRLVYATPEETVRQQILSYLINDLKVPKGLIRREVPLSHYSVKATGKADILIEKIEDGFPVPFAVIECKAPGVFLGEKEIDQIVEHANEICCDYIMISNGHESFLYHYEEAERKFLPINEFPVYEDMVKSKDEEYIIEPVPERIPFDQLEKTIIEDRSFGESDNIGYNMPIDKAVMCLNLWDCLLDVNVTMPTGKYRIFDLIEDLGIRLLSCGKTSGGVFSGPYRSFLIEFKGENQIISFGFSPYSTRAKPDIEKTSLNVAIDTDESAHHSLQLVIDDNVISNGDEFLFYHHGRISVGNRGGGRVDELKKEMTENCPYIITEDKIFLGKLKNNKLFKLTDDCVKELIENLISYALIREVYKNKKIKNKD